MKDTKGHGSNKKNTGTAGMRLVKTHVNGPHSAKVYKNPEWGEFVTKFFHNGAYQPKADSHTDDASDAHSTAQYQLRRYIEQDAKATLANGHPKSAPVPTHPAQGGTPTPHDNWPDRYAGSSASKAFKTEDVVRAIGRQLRD